MDTRIWEKHPPIDHITTSTVCGNMAIDIARFDTVDNMISGNKYYKLHYSIHQAINERKPILTYGGIHSNHLHATAAACQIYQIENCALIRNWDGTMTPTLQDCHDMGMKLKTISAEDYRKRRYQITDSQHYIEIPEGGHTENGISGASQMYYRAGAQNYDIIIMSVGSGTTIKAWTKNLLSSQIIVGILPMKIDLDSFRNHLELNSPQVILFKADRWGKFGKIQDELVTFAHDFLRKQNIPLDYIYNAKSIYEITHNSAICSLLQNKKVMYVHTGGLQGNRSYDLTTNQN